MARGRKKSPATGLKRALDKSITSLGNNSEELANMLEQLAHADLSQATEQDKAELKKLEEDLLALDDFINKLIKE